MIIVVSSAMKRSVPFWIFLKLWWFTPSKKEQLQLGMEFQENEAQKD